MPLVASEIRLNPKTAQELRKETAHSLFQGSYSPEGAMAGLWLYAGGWNEAHQIAQDLHTREGSYWHAIVHRQEPDAWNSNYWFRQVGQHPIFPALAKQGTSLATEYPSVKFAMGATWEPGQFIQFCEQARTMPGSDAEKLARKIQHAEWKLLFDYCVRR